MLYNSRPKEAYQSEKNRKIQEIYKDEMNNECFDCRKPNPDFISANNGVFICRECMAIHYQFSDEVSLIIKNNLFLLNEEQINYIYFGGNRKLLEFIKYKFPKLQEFEPELLYKTQAMQYYRDNLYYLAEGGNKPIKPTENCAYNLIPNLETYTLIQNKESEDYININNSRNNRHYKIKKRNKNSENGLNNEENLEEEEDEIVSNLNVIDNDESFFNKNKNKTLNKNNYVLRLPYSNSFVYNKRKNNILNESEENYEDNRNNNFSKTNRQKDNNNLTSNNSTKNNYNQKRDKFFNEMNRLFGGSGLEEEENLDENRSMNTDVENRNQYIKRNYQNKNRNNTYKAKRPKENLNYNNYIKNTININNNNTNIFLDENTPFNKNILSKSQIMHINQNNIQKSLYNKSIIQNRKYILNIKSQNIDPILRNKNNYKKKNIGNIITTKTVYIKPKLNSYNSNIIRSPIIKGNENDFNSITSAEIMNSKRYSLNLNSDNNIDKRDKRFKNALSPITLLSPINNFNTQKIVFNKRYSNYSLKLKNKQKDDIIYNNIIVDGRASTPIPIRNQDNNRLNIGNINEKEEEEKEEEENEENEENEEEKGGKEEGENSIKEINNIEFDYTEQMNNCEKFDNSENSDGINLNKNINNEKLLKYNKIKLEQEKEQNFLETQEELNNINQEENQINNLEQNKDDNIENSEEINNKPFADLNVEKIDEIKIVDEKEGIFDGFHDKQVLSQRNITEEIKEEKAEDEEEESEKYKLEKKEQQEIYNNN